MLYRRRAWDIMRTEFPEVEEKATLGQVIEALQKSLVHNPDNSCVLVTTGNKRLVGFISIRNIMLAMGPDLIKKTARSSDEVSYEKAFILACQLGAQTGIKKVIQKDVPRIRPNDTLARIVEVFLDYNRELAVVEEGEKIMGTVTLADIYQEIARNAMSMGPEKEHPA